MNAVVPLSLLEEIPLKSAGCRCGCSSHTSKIASGENGHFAFYDEHSIALCVCSDEQISVTETLFFREENDVVVLSSSADSALYNYSNSSDSQRSPVATIDFVSSAKCHISFVKFISPTLVDVGTEGGHFYRLKFTSDSSATTVVEHIVKRTEEFSPCRFDSLEDALLVSAGGACFVYFFCQKKWVEVNTPSFVDPLWKLYNVKETLYVWATSSVGRDTSLFTIADETVRCLFKDIILTDQHSDDYHSPNRVLVMDVDVYNQLTLLITVCTNCVVVSYANSEQFTVSATIKNELTFPLCDGEWIRRSSAKGLRQFAVFREDLICLVYNVVLDDKIKQVVLSDQIPIVSYPAKFLSLGGKDDRIVSIQGNIDLSQARDGAITLYEKENHSKIIPTVKNVPTARDESSILLFETSILKDEYVFIFLRESGSCYLIPYSFGCEEKLIAFEELPSSVSSCTALECLQSASTKCVLGYTDGSVKVFVDGSLSASISMVHTNPVTKIVGFRGPDPSELFFLSASVPSGTVCFHDEDSGEVTRTLTSPHPPLTECFIDQGKEYIYIFSEDCGNMWHVPTCRLERYFSRGDDVGQPLASRIRLFESPWGPSLKTNCLRFRGRRYFSVLIKMLKNVPTSPLGLKAFRTSLALLCMYSGEACPVAQIENESLKCVLSKLSLEIKPRRDAKVVLTAMSSACVYLQALRHEATPAWSTLKLFHRLAACLSECKVPAETCVMAYYCTVYGCTSRTPTSVHACFKTLISGLDCLPEFVVNLVKERSGALHEACEFVSDLGVMVTSDLALALSLAVLGNSMDVLPHGDWVPTVTPLVQFLEDDLVRSIQLASGCLSARQEMDEATFKSFMALMELHCMVQYDPTVLSPALLTLWRTLFDAICGGAFESDESSLFHQQCVAALECLASHNLDLFLLTTVKPLYQKRKAWRYNWIVFLSRFLRHYPGESFRCSGSLMDFTVQTLAALEDSAKEEKQTCLSAVNQMLKNVTHYLPNVSLQVQRQHLLVGQKDGMVKVYNLKNGSIVDQFMTYRNIPVLAVAYSSNHESSDIAVVPETGDSLQLWGAPRQVNTFANFFSGPQKVSFALNQTFDLSPFKSTDKSDRQLGPAERVALYRFCSLRWLSPQCVEFTSPWHVKAQFSW